tara:strand:+ start:1965 stop:5417 length:3453 start_codon:yes stop_codon:yes gene_type:complete
MANLQQTYSGDLTSALAGAIANKVINAAGMAKEQKEKSAKDNITSQPGSLFASALGHEFGGDLFNRTLGNFSSKIPFKQTDPSSSKEARFRAKFPGNTDGPVKRAEDKLKEDDGSLPVSDAQVRQFASKLLGANVEKKLNVVEFSVNQLSGEIRSLNSTLGSTQNLIFDQNQMLASKFDQILEVFSTNRQFQEEIVEKGKAERREVELEKEQDLSSAVKLAEFDKPEPKTGNNFLDALQRIRSLADKKKLNLFKDLLDNVKKPGRTSTAALRNVAKLFTRELEFGKIGAESKGIRESFERFYMSSMRDFQYDTRTPMQKSGYNTTDDLIEGFATGNISFGKDGEIIVKAKPQRQGKEALENLLGAPPGLFGDAPMGVTEKLGREAADTLQSNMIYMTRVIGNDVSVDKLGEALQDPKRFSKLQQQLQREMGMGLSEEVARDILTQASALKTDFAQKSGKLAPEAAEAIAAKAGTKAGAEAFVKGTTKSTKMLGKAGKFTPGVGTGIALAEAAFRFGTGDVTGGALSLLSAIPVAGWAFTAIDIGRDLGFNPLGLPEYETGTGYTKKGPGILHGTEARVTDKNRSDLNNSVLDSFNSPINYLASATQSFASKTGTTRAVSSMIKDSGVSYDFVNVPFSPDVGNLQQASSVREPSRAIERLLRLRDRQIFNQYKKLQDPEDLDRLDPKNLDKADNMESPQPQVQQIAQANLSQPTGKTAITFSKEQGVDASGEPGVDFSFEDYKSNYSLFDGVVVETGKLYGSGYGNVVTIRSKDANGREFDAMYAHFGDGTIAVKAGQKVKAGDYLGPVGWDEANGRPAPGAGNMTGPHTSLDFFEPNTKPGEVTGPFTDRGPIIESILQGGVPSTEGGGGGIGGPGMMGPQSPMSNADYYSLLAISALEDDDDQGRADVAQALYNRLEGHRAGSNYYQKNNTLKSHIVAKDQFQPTFYNKADWHRIVDMETAITALVMSKKGRARGWTRDYALQVLNDTEKALLNPELQAEAARHVKGRTYFLGTSEQGNMQAGDVLRNPDDNFFSMWYDEDNPYGSNGVPPAAAIPPRMIAPDPGPPPPPPIAPPSNQWWDMLDLFPNQSKLNDMERISSNMDQMEDGIPVQMVVVNNTIIKNNTSTRISSSKSFDNPVRRYQMAALGA